MHHLHIDTFAGFSSPIHNIDARAKIITTFCAIFLVILTPDGYFLSFAIYLTAAVGIVYLSHVPMGYIFKRSLILIPFVLLASLFVPFTTSGSPLFTFTLAQHTIMLTEEGLVRFTSIGLRAFVSFILTITLVSTTRFGNLMRAASNLGLPSKLVIVLSFMYRYLFILIDEAAHMMLARELRSSNRQKKTLLTASGGIIGSLFIRSYEHAEKLYSAMLFRGYSGEPVSLVPLRLTGKDVVLSIIFLSIACCGFSIGKVIHG